jgi:hypothetical protein
MPSINPGPNVQQSINTTAVYGTPAQQNATPVYSCEEQGAFPGASGQANNTAIQAALNLAGANGGGYVSLTNPGTYSVLPFTQLQTNTIADWAMMTIPDNTTLYIGPGVNLVGPPSSQSYQKSMFVNSNMLSNLVNVQSAAYVAGTGDDVQSIFITFQAAGHSYKAGQYVLIKGDTSGYGYNRVWLVDSVVAGVSFTVRDYYSMTPLALSGTVISYLANSNIRVICDGLINMRANQNYPAWMNNPYTRSAMVFNKIGRIQVEANFFNVGICMAFCNADDVIVDRLSHIDGALGVCLDGPLRKATIRNVIGKGTEECVLIRNEDTNTVNWYLADQNGTVNSFGNVDDVTIDGVSLSENIIRGVAILPGGGYTIGRVSMKNVYQRYARAQILTIYGHPGSTGTLNELDISDVNITPYYIGQLGQPMLVIDGQTTGTMNIGKIQLDRIVAKGGDGCVGFATSDGAGLIGAYAGTAINIREISINDSYIDMDCNLAGANGAVYLAATGLAVTEIQAKNFTVNQNGSTNATSMINLGLSTSSIARINSCKLIGTVGNSPLVNLTTAGHVLYMTDCANNNGNAAMVYATVGFTGRFDHCQQQTNGGRLMRLNATSATFNLAFADCDAQGVFFGGLANAQSNIFNITSGGGNKTTGSTWYDVVTGSTFNFSGDCSDWHGDITAISRTAGTIFFNTNAAAGTLVQNNLAVCDATGAANSWHQMTVPTNVY